MRWALADFGYSGSTRSKTRARAVPSGTIPGGDEAEALLAPESWEVVDVLLSPVSSNTTNPESPSSVFSICKSGTWCFARADGGFEDLGREALEGRGSAGSCTIAAGFTG